MSAALLIRLLKNPQEAEGLSLSQWNEIICAAKGERLLASLASRLEDEGLSLPDDITPILADALFDAQRERRQALWEADRAAEALRGLNIPVVLLKGTAYAAAGLCAGEGRLIGDLDIMVPQDRLDDVEQALLAAGWEWVKADPYDNAYYRQWMHELPPLIHRERDRMIDVHHTILPLTARQTPDAAGMLARRVDIGGGLSVLSPEDMVCHAVAHLFADGDMAGGLRNLWDIHCLCSEYAAKFPDFFLSLHEEAHRHGLLGHIGLALRLAQDIYGTRMVPYQSPMKVSYEPRWSDHFFYARLLTRDGWGRDRRPFLRLAFYIRSHWLRMPPLMLARHLWTKWRKGHRPQ